MAHRPRLLALATTALATLLAGQAAFAQPAPATQENPSPGAAESPPPVPQPAPGQPGFLSQLFTPDRTNLLGDLYGVRPALKSVGVSLGLSEASELFGNATGGVRQGAAYHGLTILSVGVDTDAAFGLPGGIFNASAFQIHGRSLSGDNLFTLQTASGIEANRATRLWELWYQQSFLGGKLDVKAGQQSLDQEFITSAGASAFINTAFGWPVAPSVDLYAGGPAYPLSAVGVRLRAAPTPALTLLAGVFDDNPPGGPFNDDSQLRGAEQSGARFNLGTGALFIAEAQYAINQPPADGKGESSGLPGLYKIGGFYDTGRFPDQRVDAFGQPLASASSPGTGRPRRGNWMGYAVADQTVWKPDAGAPFAVSLFMRIMGSPSDRNLVDLAANAGVVVKAPLPGRDNDTFGVGYGFARVSRNTALFDQDTLRFNGQGSVRSSESFVEVTYQVQVAPWWAVQPDFQYVWTPGGGLTNPLDPARRIGNEAVFGVRTNITF